MIIDNEHWKPTCVFPEHYFVSDKGEVYSVRTGKVLRPGVDKDGYLTHILCVNGKRRTARVHRLVAMAFIPIIGGSEGDVSGCLSGTKKTCHGFTFKRVDDKF